MSADDKSGDGDTNKRNEIYFKRMLANLVSAGLKTGLNSPVVYIENIDCRTMPLPNMDGKRTRDLTLNDQGASGATAPILGPSAKATSDKQTQKGPATETDAELMSKALKAYFEKLMSYKPKNPEEAKFHKDQMNDFLDSFRYCTICKGWSERKGHRH